MVCSDWSIDDAVTQSQCILLDIIMTNEITIWDFDFPECYIYLFLVPFMIKIVVIQGKWSSQSFKDL